MSLDVCLVVMPFGPLEQPGMGPSILKAALTQKGISSSVVYANLVWAEEIGFELCDRLSKLATHDLTPEWVFSNAAFPGFDPRHDEYFAYVGRKLEFMERFVLSPLDPRSMTDLLWTLRRKSTDFVERMARDIIQKRPRIVACSSTYQQHCASLALLKLIRAIEPGITTVVGGVNCESSMGVVTRDRCPWIDYVVSGEADVVFPQLCHRVLHEEGGDPLPGVLDRTGSVPPTARVTDMADSPTPDFDDYFSALEASPLRDKVRPFLPIEMSRGCSWSQVSQCVFCGADSDGMFVRSKQPERVIEEIRALSRRYGIDVFAGVDVNLDSAYFDTLLPDLSEASDSYNILWMVRPDLSRDKVALLSTAGFKWVFAGIESFDDEILGGLNKGTTGASNIQFLKWAREFGIFVGWLFLHGLAGDSDETYGRLAKWLPLISHLQPPIALVPVQYRRFSPHHRRQGEFGLSLGADPSYSYVYPFAQEDLDDLAYFLRDRGECVRSVRRAEGGPGVRDLRDRIGQWQNAWTRNAELRDRVCELTMEDAGAELEIRDTRPCATVPIYHLDGLRRLVYLVCDRGRVRRQIRDRLATEHGTDIGLKEIEPVLEDLLEKGLMLELGGTLLSLAVRGPSPPVRPFPRTWG
jgi:ribosomal peptide maturation radical SAM protein 1